MATGTIVKYPHIIYKSIASNQTATVSRPSWAKYALIIKTQNTAYVTLEISYGSTTGQITTSYNAGGYCAINLISDITLRNIDQYSNNGITCVVIFF